MKKPLSFPLLLLLSILLLSWGNLGHQTVGLIGDHHLTSSAKAAVQYYLDGEGLTDVSTWADDVRGTSSYKHTASWHFLNMPTGLNRQQFEKEVKNLSTDNIYKALLESERTLRDAHATKDQKREALKFVVHLVGDLHQPMHVSRAEDKGGNTIQVNYEGKGTNLHSLWDSRLLEHQGLSKEQLLSACDKASAADIKQWQKDPVMQWLWESYQLSSGLYSEVEAMKTRTIPDSYYRKYIPVINKRLDQAGIRLAGLLNAVFKGYTALKEGAIVKKAVIATDTTAVKPIELGEVSQHIGEKVLVKGKIVGIKNFKTMTLLNLGAPYPNQLLTVVVKGDIKDQYKFEDGKTITVTGKVELYQGKPQIAISSAGDFTLK